MKNKSILLTLLIAISVLFSGCLTCESKDFTYVINKDGSVNLTIIYNNIMSNHSDSEEDEESTSATTLEADFEDLMSNYVGGSNPESDYNNVIVESKRLYENNGVLNGEVKLKFPSIADAKLYYNAKKKFIIKDFCSSFTETLSSTNGESADSAPFVMWDSKMKTLTYSTSVSSAGDEANTSLLSRWKNR